MRLPLPHPRPAPFLAIVSLAVLVVACVPASRPPEPAAPTPIPRPVPRPLPVAPVQGADWRDWPLTPGTWSYRRDERGSIALFGPAGGDAVLTLRCDLGARRLYLSRAGTVATPLTIRTSTMLRSVAVQPTGGVPAYVAATLATGDTLLEAIGFSRGRFVIEQAGAPTLVVPAWAEIERVTEDCRS